MRAAPDSGAGSHLKTRVIRPIETMYKGYRFRSRLEARWGICFDVLGLQWDYEKEGYDLGNGIWYLPDFWLSDLGCFAEVKAKQLTYQEWARCAALPHPCLILDGMPDLRFWGTTRPSIPDENCITPYDWYASGASYGRVELATSAHRKRFWYCYGETIADYETDLWPAVQAARGARFEHGEHGT